VYMAAPPDFFAQVHALCGQRVTPVAILTNDMWMRDTGAVFVTNSEGALGGIDFNFNGWGDKQVPRAADAAIAREVCAHVGISRLETTLTGEGGGLEYDGDGTLLLTDSCWLNNNRNPGVARAAMTAEFQRLLGVEKVIWLPGVRGEDITDGHIDGSIRFVRPGVILTSGYPDDSTIWGSVMRESREILQRETDARGRSFQLVDIPSAMHPRNTHEDLFTGYANYYVANGAVFTPTFGDAPADRLAQTRLAKLFPGREVVSLEVDRIYECGGGIHCVTQQQPKPRVSGKR
ncbi:MAG: agmatine deiminase family protein, partial [Pseudomonadota bacterium]